MEALNTGGADERYLEFSMGTQLFAVPILMVREVISVPEVTKISGAPNYFDGLMNLRGQIITVIDLRTKMGLKTEDSSSEEAVIVLMLDSFCFGIKVDSINRVLTFLATEVSNVPELSLQIKADYINGIYQKKDELVVLLNISKVLNISDKNLMQQKAAA